jgi:hypothetical protein
MSEFTHFSPRAPRSVTVVADSQTMVSKRTSDHVYTVMYITNNSDVPVYLGFRGPNDPNGNAKAKQESLYFQNLHLHLMILYLPDVLCGLHVNLEKLF